MNQDYQDRGLDDPQRIVDEARYLMARLRQIGGTGDSAYENAMCRFYEIELDSRLRRLAALGLEVHPELALSAPR
jgi:hypothetical protein